MQVHYSFINLLLLGVNYDSHYDYLFRFLSCPYTLLVVLHEEYIFVKIFLHFHVFAKLFIKNYILNRIKNTCFICRVKVFRGRKIHSEYDIKVEQVCGRDEPFARQHHNIILLILDIDKNIIIILIKHHHSIPKIFKPAVQ